MYLIVEFSSKKFEQFCLTTFSKIAQVTFFDQRHVISLVQLKKFKTIIKKVIELKEILTPTSFHCINFIQIFYLNSFLIVEKLKM